MEAGGPGQIVKKNWFRSLQSFTQGKKPEAGTNVFGKNGLPKVGPKVVPKGFTN
jgi:hypothetical protein